jgi:CHASE1-domain containing sensor protein
MTIEQSTVVALTLFVIGLVYHAGRQAQRIDDIERRFTELAKALREDIADLNGLLRAVIGEWRQLRAEHPRVAPPVDGE